MKKHLIFVTILIMFTVGCTDSVNETEPIEEEQLTDYSSELEKLFPVKLGDSFNYSVDTLNLQSNNFENIGSRVVNVKEKEPSSNVYLCTEQYEIINSIIESQSKFRINENTIEFFYDSTGLAELIPDSIDIELTIEESFKLVEYPFEIGKKWSAFKAGANFGTFVFKLFSITGEYLGSELIQLDGFESVSNTEKFKYEIALDIPEISNPFVSNIQKYSATIWFSSEMGIVQFEGCEMIINPITGRAVDVSDSNKVIRHSLINN